MNIQFSVYFLRLLLIVNLLAIYCPANSQNKNDLLFALKTIENDNELDDANFKVPMQRMFFSEDVYQVYIDSTNQKMYLSTRKKGKKTKKFKSKGHVGSLDLSSMQFDWQSTIDYSKHAANIKDRYMIRYKSRKNVMIDLVSGQELWDVKSDIVYTNGKLNIGMGYKKLGFGSDFRALQGIDLATGKVIWNRDVSRKFGWRQVHSISDSTILISGLGIDFINLKTGGGWFISQKTGREKINLLLGKKRFVNLGSNIVVDSSGVNFYHAAEDIIKFDSNGKVIWKTSLDTEDISKMFLYEQGPYLYLINSGGTDVINSNRYYTYGEVGQPYVAKIDKADGRILLRASIFSFDKDYFYNFNFNSDSRIIALSKKELVFIDFNKEKLIQRITLDGDVFGKNKTLYEFEPFILQDGEIKSLSDRYPAVLYDTDDEVYNLVSHYGDWKAYNPEDLYFKREISEGIDLIYGDEKASYLVDENLEIKAKFKLLELPFILDNKIYSFKNKVLFIHDLDNINLN